MYLRVDSFSEYDKSWFAVADSFTMLHSKTENYDESGTIISGEERINEIDSHGSITKQDLYLYDEFEKYEELLNNKEEYYTITTDSKSGYPLCFFTITPLALPFENPRDKSLN